MSIDSAWIFRICLVTTVFLILFADFLGYGGANARKSDQKNDNSETYSSNKGAVINLYCYVTRYSKLVIYFRINPHLTLNYNLEITSSSRQNVHSFQ